MGESAANIVGLLHATGYLSSKKRKKKLVKAFNPDEPRDAHGRWVAHAIPMSPYSGDIEELTRFYENRGAKTEIVPFDQLRATQAVVDSQWQKSSDDSKVSLPLGIRMPDGNMHIIDGHNRINAMMQAGKTSTTMRVHTHSQENEAAFQRWQKVSKAAEPRTLYVNRPVLNAADIIAWAKQNGFAKTVTPDDMHVTIAFSKAPVLWPEPQGDTIRLIPADPTIARFGPEGECVVLTFGAEALEARWQEFLDKGASWDWPSYEPHATLSYSAPDDLDVTDIEPYRGVIVLGPEEFDEVKEDWADDVVEKAAIDGEDDMDLTDAERMQKIGARNNKSDKALIQTMHDHACALGAECGGMAKSVVEVDQVRIAKVDESMGLVFGYAIVCKVNGEPYYDLNIDKLADGSFARVPEHVPEEAMLKAAVEFMQTARVGNEMHSGPDHGSYVFAFPLTEDIAKAFGITTSKTGLMVAYKPPPEVFAKYKSGEYTGFSIEGKRLAFKDD